MSLWCCPLCGKRNSIKHYAPSEFYNDITIVVLRSLGRAKGFDDVSEYSIFDGHHPELLELIRDRVAVIDDFLYEETEDDDEDDESLSELAKELRRDEEEDDDKGEEDEDINDLEENIIE